MNPRINASVFADTSNTSYHIIASRLDPETIHLRQYSHFWLQWSWFLNRVISPLLLYFHWSLVPDMLYLLWFVFLFHGPVVNQDRASDSPDSCTRSCQTEYEFLRRPLDLHGVVAECSRLSERWSNNQTQTFWTKSKSASFGQFRIKTSAKSPFELVNMLNASAALKPITPIKRENETRQSRQCT